jgi:Stage II sporulation protein E (SpoIIE)
MGRSAPGRDPLPGFFPDIQLADVRFRLAPGDTLLLYADGATEAREQLSSPEAGRPLSGENARRRRAHPPGSPCRLE